MCILTHQKTEGEIDFKATFLLISLPQSLTRQLPRQREPRVCAQSQLTDKSQFIVIILLLRDMLSARRRGSQF